MAPVLRARQSLSKDKFSGYFGNLRSQPYNDPNNSRGSNPHRYVLSDHGAYSLIPLADFDGEACDASPGTPSELW